MLKATVLGCLFSITCGCAVTPVDNRAADKASHDANFMMKGANIKCIPAKTPMADKYERRMVKYVLRRGGQTSWQGGENGWWW
jgi:hypothetical protein